LRSLAFFSLSSRYAAFSYYYSGKSLNPPGFNCRPSGQYACGSFSFVPGNATAFPDYSGKSLNPPGFNCRPSGQYACGPFLFVPGNATAFPDYSGKSLNPPGFNCRPSGQYACGILNKNYPADE